MTLELHGFAGICMHLHGFGWIYMDLHGFGWIWERISRRVQTEKMENGFVRSAARAAGGQTCGLC
jgi:hypothetical protein